MGLTLGGKEGGRGAKEGGREGGREGLPHVFQGLSMELPLLTHLLHLCVCNGVCYKELISITCFLLSLPPSLPPCLLSYSLFSPSSLPPSPSPAT